MVPFTEPFRHTTYMQHYRGKSFVRTCWWIRVHTLLSGTPLQLSFDGNSELAVSNPQTKCTSAYSVQKKRHVYGCHWTHFTGRGDCAACYVTYHSHRYNYVTGLTPAHISEIWTAANSVNRWESDRCGRDISDWEFALEINPEILTLMPGTPCISTCIWKFTLLRLWAG
jgi:hypothetical protein